MDDDTIGIKVTLIGESSVGKTYIIKKYCKNIFNSDIESTLGANYSQQKLVKRRKHIRLVLWDTDGQETYIGRHFYK